MDDLISREAAIKAIEARAVKAAERKCKGCAENPFWEGLIIARELVARMPAVQLQSEPQLIRCGKCAFADGVNRECTFLGLGINEDFFCCWARPLGGAE